jgi:hypothetical protein
LPAHSREATVGAQYLTVHPTPIRASQKRDDTRDLRRLTQTFQRRHLGELLDSLLALAVEEQISCDWTRGHRVDGDIPAAQLLGKHAGKGLDRGLRAVVDDVSGQIQGESAAGEVDDAAPRCSGAYRLREGC